MNLLWDELDDRTKRLCAELWMTVWPNGRDQDVEARLERMSNQTLRSYYVHLAFDDDLLVAVARTFVRTIEFVDEVGKREECEVLALASVCSHPDRRGHGWGQAVTNAAFERTRDENVVALFQTGVPEFYERLGSREVSNEVFTSEHGATAFSDDCVMIYPATAAWDDNVRIDLCGSGW